MARKRASQTLQLDEIGYWSEIKLDMICEYASAYSVIMATQPLIRRHVYVDAFAGAGTHVSKATGETVSGSPVNAMAIHPPFSELHLIDLDGTRTAELRRLAADDPRVRVYEGDCNEILLRDVFPRCRFEDYRRALCLLDPYKLNVNWEVLLAAGQMKSVDVFYNFMIMDANMNVFMRDSSKVAPEQAARMDAVWGDNSWRTAAYRQAEDLFGTVEEKATNEDIAEAFRKRLESVGEFAYVPKPIPMRNSRGATVYYLYFATAKAVAAKIVSDIFNKYRDREAA
jgi:three-Cys-motif partner protein